jgi:hypothetical protein
MCTCDHNQSKICFFLCAHSVSVTIFQTFSCHDVGSHDEEEEYMTADYSVSCASERYSFAFWWAVAMVFVYPIGRQSRFIIGDETRCAMTIMSCNVTMLCDVTV